MDEEKKMQIYELMNYFEPIVVSTSTGWLCGDLHHDLKANITGLRLPAAAGSLKTRLQDSFRFKYAKNTYSFNQAWISLLVEYAGLVQRTGVQFPSLAVFL